MTGSAAGMSQPAVYITVTNTSGSACVLTQYPSITRALAKKRVLPITVTNGAVNNAPQAKRKKIRLAKGKSAWFAVGAATAFDGQVVTISRLRYATSKGGPTKRVKVSLTAQNPQGSDYPLGVTAFMKGVSPTQG